MLSKQVASVCAIVLVASIALVVSAEEGQVEFPVFIKMLDAGSKSLMSPLAIFYDVLHERVIVEDDKIKFEILAEDIYDMMVRDILSRNSGCLSLTCLSLKKKVTDVADYKKSQVEICELLINTHEMLLEQAAQVVVSDCALLTKKRRKLLAQARSCAILLSDQGDRIYDRLFYRFGRFIKNN